eukprot:5128641-Karenia_brevis.AAC.1
MPRGKSDTFYHSEFASASCSSEDLVATPMGLRGQVRRHAQTVIGTTGESLLSQGGEARLEENMATAQESVFEESAYCHTQSGHTAMSRRQEKRQPPTVSDNILSA